MVVAYVSGLSWERRPGIGLWDLLRRLMALILLADFSESTRRSVVIEWHRSESELGYRLAAWWNTER